MYFFERNCVRFTGIVSGVLLSRGSLSAIGGGVVGSALSVAQQLTSDNSASIRQYVRLGCSVSLESGACISGNLSVELSANLGSMFLVKELVRPTPLVLRPWFGRERFEWLTRRCFCVSRVDASVSVL
jgi:hypothetical protein